MLLILLSRKIFGIAFTMKLMEYNKMITNEKLNAAMKQFSFSTKENELLRKMVMVINATTCNINHLVDILTTVGDYPLSVFGFLIMLFFTIVVPIGTAIYLSC
jgi:hypothetical protein